MIEWIISSTVLLAVLLLLRLCLKGRIGLRLQYVLWLLAAVRLLVPFSLGTSRLSVMNPVEHSDFYRAAVATEATTAPNVSAPTVVEPDVPPILPSTGTSPAAPVRPADPITPVTPVTPVFPADPQPEPEESLWQRFGRIAKIVWVVGGAGMLLALAAVNLHLAARLKRSRTPLQTDSPLPVWQSNAVQTPCLFGLWRPTIYVTAETAADETVLRHCLRHEETHYRHGDHLWAVVRALCLAIHWYNPLVWLAAFCSKTDAELACDEATIRTLGESERAAYGRTLLTLTAAARPPVLAVATTMTDGKRIKERIKLIVKKPKTAVLTLIAVIVIAAVAVGCTYTGAGGETTSSEDDDPALTATASVLTTVTTPPMSDQPPTTTTVPPTPDYLYYDVSAVPGVYRLYAQTAADSDEAVYEAAEVLVGEMLDAMKQSDPSRSFVLTEYKDVELRLHHSSEVLDRTQEWGIAADSALVNDDVWLVYVDVAFRFEGLYGAIGKPIDDRWWTVLHQGGAAPMILLKTEDSYLLWWANAYAEGYPKEVSAHLFDENVTELLPVDPNWTPSAALKHTLEHGGDTPVVLFFGENQARAAEIAYDEQVGTLLERYSWTAIERPASDPAGIRIEVLTRDGMEAFVIYDTVPTIIRHVDLNNLERPLTYWQQRGAGVPIALMLRYALFGEVGERTPESALEEMARASDVSYVTLRAGAESSPTLIAEKADGTILYYLQQYSWTEGGDRPVDEAAYYLTITSGDGRRSLTMWDENDKSYLHYTDGIISRSWMAAPRDEYRQFAADIRKTVYDPLVSGATNTQPFAPAVETAIRAALLMPEGELTADLLATIRALTITFDLGAADVSLAGLELCTALDTLVINNYQGKSLEFLRDLPALTTLSLDWWDSMTPETVYDLAPLAAQTSLKRLSIDGYRVPDLSALQTLTSLEELWLHRTGVSDLTPLAGLTGLRGLSLGHYTANGLPNGVTDLTPLAGMGRLEYLHLVYFRGSLAAIQHLPIRSLVIAQCTIDSFADLPSTVESLLIDSSGFADADIAALKNSGKLQYLVLGDRLTDASMLSSLSLQGCAYAFDETASNKDSFPGRYNALLMQRGMLD